MMADDIAIRVENLSKRYRIGAKEEVHDTLAGILSDWVKRPAHNLRRLRDLTRFNENGQEPEDIIWALKNVSFEVKRGEVVGIIGRNGAGKSTLLKILSRITHPTRGRVELNGRVSSLLEVGTGFHPELSGRENIFLNGTILGMRRVEIDSKFDEIVDFSGVEKFIDTPVKRYSSGMRMRLAFAVAAHIEPQILLIDEVLAVGDAEFQQKSLGKIGDVTQEGRTVLFVSHNMQALKALCESSVLLEQGRIIFMGKTLDAIDRYLPSTYIRLRESVWSEESAPGNEQFRLLAVRVTSANRQSEGLFLSSNDIIVEIDFKVATIYPALCVGFDLLDQVGAVLLRSYQTDLPIEDWPKLQIGRNRWTCTIPAGMLNSNIYEICPRIGLHNLNWIVKMESVLQFEVIVDHGVSPFWNGLNGRNRPGLVAPILNWNEENPG
jgi:lipopolysaccharide transport system ATP-binding protein